MEAVVRISQNGKILAEGTIIELIEQGSGSGYEFRFQIALNNMDGIKSKDLEIVGYVDVEFILRLADHPHIIFPIINQKIQIKDE